MQTAAQIEARLVEVRAAIASILNTGQAFATDGRSLTNANLKDLQQHEEWLEGKLVAATRAASGRGRNRIMYVDPE